jgi:hypothetical protein
MCNWLVKGTQEYCKNPTKKPFCGRHAFALRRGASLPIPCKSCGSGTNSVTQLCLQCGQGKVLMASYRAKKRNAN